ncbi:MAG: hypothetical protein PHN45_02660 [Methylococcales bacterium]|nr:hypothetical protein [Methylococcales bacterium]MDD5753632.1 hypothetical protein [Methylococcales bacterium]
MATTTLTVDDLSKVSYSGEPTIDAFLGEGMNWNYLKPARNVLYYTFDIKNLDDTNLKKPVASFNSAQQQATRTILDYASGVTGIKFEETASGKDADVHFANTDLDTSIPASVSSSYGYGYNSKNTVTSYTADAYVYLDNVEFIDLNGTPTAGTQGYELLLREVGQMLGLKNPFESANPLPESQDSSDNTVMSIINNGEYKTTFQPFDVAALTWIYGKDGLGGAGNIIELTVPPVDQHPDNLPTGSVTINGKLTQGQTLTAINSFVDADGLGAFSYQWLKNGAPINGATRANYQLTENDVGNIIKVKVSYTDGLGHSDSITSNSTDLIQSEENKTPTYALSVDKTTVNENSAVTFKLTTTNVAEGDEIPISFSGTISAADVLGGLKTTRFVVEADGTATLPIKFIEDHLAEKAETLTVTLNSDKQQTATVTVKDILSSEPVISWEIINGKNEKGKATSELMIGTEKNDSLSGMAGADTLRGNAGNDVLDGGVGNDSLDGGTGDDYLIGGDGNDKLLGGSGNDKLDGGKGNDSIDGAQGKDTLIGGAGVDSMSGGDGDDYYYVDNIKDVVIENSKDAKNVKLGGNDTVESTSSSYTLGPNIENLVLNDIQGKGNSGTGNAGNNVITGSVGDNFLSGMAGNDKLDGGDGDDTLDGGLGMDTLIGGNGSDLYYMNNTQDIIIEKEDGGEQDQIIAQVDFDLNQSANVEVLTLSGAKAINGTGTPLNDLLQEESGGKVNNSFTGGEGNDTINGEGGDDTLEGGEGDDELDGGDGNDTAVFTGAFDDYQITHNPDAEGVDQLVVEYKGNDESIKDGIDILTNIEVLQFASGDTRNVRDIDMAETNSSSMVILTGVETS